MKKAKTVASLRAKFNAELSAVADRAIAEIEKLPTATKRQLSDAYDLSGQVTHIEYALSPAVYRRLRKLDRKLEELMVKKEKLR